jgi:hypothetical protein
MDTASETTPTTQNTNNDTTEKNTKSEHRLTNVIVENEIVALNLLVQFLGLAQKRGAFTIDEAAKIWECVQKFQKPEVQNPASGL